MKATLLVADGQDIERMGLCWCAEQSGAFDRVVPVVKPGELSEWVGRFPDCLLVCAPSAKFGFSEGLLCELRRKFDRLRIVTIGETGPKDAPSFDGWLSHQDSAAHVIALLRKVARAQIRKSDVIGSASHDSLGPGPLSPAEREVFTLMARGCSTREIAESLHRSEHTVSTHRKHILAKLNLPNTTALIRWAYEKGWARP